MGEKTKRIPQLVSKISSSLLRMFWRNCVQCIQLKHITLTTVAFHFFLLVRGIEWTIMDIIDEQEPVSFSEVSVIAGQSFFQLALIVFLVLGVLKRKAIFLLPWLLASFIMLVIVSYYTLLFAMGSKLVYLIFNVFLLGFFWMLWGSVLCYWHRIKNLQYVLLEQ